MLWNDRTSSKLNILLNIVLFLIICQSISLLLPGLPKLLSQCYSNWLVKFSNLNSSKEIEPMYLDGVILCEKCNFNFSLFYLPV